MFSHFMRLLQGLKETMHLEDLEQCQVSGELLMDFSYSIIISRRISVITPPSRDVCKDSGSWHVCLVSTCVESP